MIGARWGLALLALTSVLAGQAHAANDEAEARKHFKKANSLYQSGQYDASIVEYEAAYRLLPLADFQFNCAQAARLKGDAEASLRYYRAYLAQAPNGRVSDEARQYVAQLARVVEAEAASRAAAESAEAARREEQARQQADARAHAAAEEHAYRRGTRARTERVAGLAAAGLGVIGIVAGGVLSSEAHSANNAFLHPANGIYSQSAYDHRAAYQTGELAGFVVGGVFLAAGVTLYLIGWRSGHRLSLSAERRAQ